MPAKTRNEDENLERYLDILPDELGTNGFMGTAYASVYALSDETFARLLFNLHAGRSPWRGIAPHISSSRFEHVANVLAEVGLVWFDQHKMRWDLTVHALDLLGGE